MPVRLARPPFTPSALQVWAVEDTSIQLTWGSLPAGPIRVSAQDRTVEIEHTGGPGEFTLSGLSPATDYRVHVDHRAGTRTLEARTLATPPGALLSRVATVSDLHIGSRRWGFLKTMVETEPFDTPFPVRCARAAIGEAIAWGAELIMIKGDAVNHRSPHNFAELGRLVDLFPDTPMLLVPGNHDVDFQHSTMELPATVGERALPFTTTVVHLDVPGLRVIAGDTSIPGQGPGTLARTGEAMIQTAAEADRPALVGVHHHFDRLSRPTHWPPGIPKAEAKPFFDDLRRGNPDVLVTSGHSHRNRARRHQGVAVTEVASTRDWPGVWAGYAVHEGGIRQVVRRVAAADAVVWHEYSRGAVLGAWEHWAPGPLAQRSLAINWSTDS